MQHLKDEIRKAIVDAAVGEFREKGYPGASMRAIAARAGITVGNIYRYFPGKDELFNYIMDPVWKDVTRVIFDNYNWAVDLFPITEISAVFMEVYRRYNNEIYILLFGSKGSKYENFKNSLVELVAKRIENEIVQLLAKDGKTVRDPFIFQIIANAIIDGMYLTVKEMGDQIDRVEALMEQMIVVFIKDLFKRL